ncbi:RasGEF domain-containing protein [Cavenderia fasciculata]|uniref:RasGEF domain-containing protein n=1 Tax=Cavenderia fasciculata TaxID=261658 RepID=F4PV26_CACFS|nr:RasGEF domain-containing protein [Cavenderia fasciculata]EGG21142.1 RasGEF domain-containing protein [Cavenderia fasciculata]|eukprot:XP_004358992.1 RasGEF domain-containing protein [Cavenderia fasciculata]
MIATILYIIFVDDVLGMAGSPSSGAIDTSIITVKICIMLYFIVDVVFCIVLYGRRYYPGTIVFWLDLFSLLSIVPDIVVFFLDDSLAHEMMVLSIGTAARIIRICGSFVRISLIATIYNRFLRKKYYLAPISTSGTTPGITTPNHSGANDNTLEVEASRLGDKLIRLTTNKIVLLVLLVFFATQLLTYQPPRDVYIHSALSTLEYQADRFGTTSPEFLGLYQQFLINNADTMTSLIVSSHVLYINQDRIDSLQRSAVSSYYYANSSISMDDSALIKKSSAYHFALTCFVILILIIVNLLIVNDAHWLVINPLENVLAIVKLLSRQNASIQHSHHQYAMHTANGVITSGHTSFRQKRLESVGSKSEDTTSSSGVDGDEVDETDEANYLLGMLNDIDGSLQAAKEKVEEESYQNAKLRNHIEDLFLEKFILNIHLNSITRKIEFDDILGKSLKKKQEMLALNIKPLADGINSDEIKYKQELESTNPTIICANLERLIDRLSKVDNHDIKFANVFLLTFRRFISPIELMERLIIRFCITPQYDLPNNVLALNETVDDWRRTKQEHFRVSVFNVIKLWIGKYYWDFQSNTTLVELFNMLVQQIMPSCRMERYALHLDTLFKRKVASYVPLLDYQPIKPLTSEEIAELMVLEDKFLFNFDIIDVATQITLIEFELFKSIRPQELIDLAWTKSKTKTKTSPNVVRFIDHFNNVSFWIQMQIVKCGKIKDRVNVIKRVIQLGESFVNLNNFYGAMEVLSSLESASVSRLHRTWDLVPVSSKETFQQLQKLLSPKGSFKEYRERLKQTTSACIPYLGIYLSDLTFIEEGNPDYREDTLINYTKLREIAATILSIQQFQNTLHYYQPIKEKIRSQLDLKCIMDNETIWKMSLSCEARRT